MVRAEQDDLAIFDALRGGNSEALQILYDRYGEAVYRLALRMLKNPTDAEDITQEVFLSFWRRGSYDPQRGSLLVVLLVMTRSLALNRLRKVQSQRNLIQHCTHHVSAEIHHSWLETLSVSELSQQVHQAISQLPAAQQQVLQLAYFEGMSQTDIAQQLNIPLGTVKTRNRQGLLKLRQLLSGLVEVS